MSKTVLITGNSSGLGHGLTTACLERGWEVYGMSRRGSNISAGKLHDVTCDLARSQDIVPALTSLLDGVERLDMVFLNAGVFGELRLLTETSRDQLDEVMEVNVWANKTILDWLLTGGPQPGKVIAISSGAAISAYPGWGPYSLSKVALNKLMALYANEYPRVHFISLAPGLVDTAMQEYLCNQDDETNSSYPLLEKFRTARGTPAMPTPKTTAENIISALPELGKLDSGSYADIRTL